jgi:hypothetical protein
VGHEILKIVRTRNLMAAFKTAEHLIPLSARKFTAPSNPISIRHILILPSHLSLGLPTAFVLQDSPPKTYTFLISPRMWYIPYLSLQFSCVIDEDYLRKLRGSLLEYLQRTVSSKYFHTSLNKYLSIHWFASSLGIIIRSNIHYKRK